MTVRIGINGFGRMGRLFLRAALEQAMVKDGAPAFEVVHINEVKGGLATAAHLLEFDSVHGRFGIPVDCDGDRLRAGAFTMTYSEFADPAEIPWNERGVDVVIECTGKFKSRKVLADYLSGSVQKVIVAAPVKDADLNIVMGVNDHLYDAASHHILTNASCTTNCLAPLIKVMQENIGIRHGMITTIHDVTNTQVIVDAPHKDLRRARSALNSLIPTSTGSAKAISMIYPELSGKLNGIAVRVPLLNASITDCVLEVERPTTVEEVNGYFEVASRTTLENILGFETRPLVSADFLNDRRSAILDAPSTMVVNETQVKLLAWYDNEMGYVWRLRELAEKVAGSLR
ncbi:ArsJ-associated glyceraldehyde-3-phosphate dehydrogenase [Sneathiella chungangensis]|uniref:Glyceraldehyde-3-phosphate dehydrogenase n=1 Tax=Sneathiella chungangensis TaxID=1418234 RepID=A0A845MH57_9PROT|nr:ArsJ-associated glyceraldehyde-3-phosphate dehydrogenase [Sneathiella chungangensis]MZR23308.1 ArsJ-associated glyceraldehyde-3-phosphate dehydrogenase [Sneathiella chungangensis]